MIHENQLEKILDTFNTRLDKFERDLLEIKNNNKIDIVVFEKMQAQINLISPIALDKPRNKTGLETIVIKTK